MNDIANFEISTFQGRNRPTDTDTLISLPLVICKYLSADRVEDTTKEALT